MEKAQKQLSQEQLDRAVSEIRSLRWFDLRIGYQGTGTLTVEKRHQQKLREMNPGVSKYEGFLVRNKDDLYIFADQAYNPSYAAYLFNPILCNYEECNSPITLNCLTTRRSDGSFLRLCQPHFEKVFGRGRRR